MLLGRDGAERQAGAAAPILPALFAMAAGLPAVRGGVRLHDLQELTELLDGDALLTSLAEERLGAAARPVRAILFDKTPDANWSLGWHQDRTICVAERRDVPGFGPWTVKQGLLHVEPPFAVVEAMLTMRVHLDPVDADNAPLLVALGHTGWGALPNPTMQASSNDAARRPALLTRAMSGSIARRSCTHRLQACRISTGACCSSTSPLHRYRAACVGRASDG